MKRMGLGLVVLALVLGFYSADALAVRNGGTFQWIAPYGISIDTLDPAATSDDKNILVILNIHRGLFGWDAKNSTYKLDLAESMTADDDGLTYVIKLKDAKFHNGRTITADDVIYSYNRLADPKKSFASSHLLVEIDGAQAYLDGKADHISGLEKIDDKTVRIKFRNPVDPGFQLWRYGTAIVPKEAAENEDFGSNPIGCGPFKLQKWTKGVEIVLVKNPEFYEPRKPYLDKLIYKIMADAAARDMAFQAGELDANLLYAAQYEKFKNDPKLSKHMMEVPEMFTRAVRFNPNFTLADGRKPFSDKRVRQAVNYAINRELIVEKYAKGKAYPARGFLAPTTPGFDPDCMSYEYNPEKAKQLMKEAGYAKGFDLTVIAGTSTAYGAGVVEAATPFLKEIGIKVTIDKMENAVLYQKYSDGEFDAAIASHSSGPDPISIMYRFHSNSPRFKQRGETSQKIDSFEQIIDLAAATRDPAMRLELVKIANDILTEEAVLWFYNYNKAVIAYQPWVHDMEPVGVEMMYQHMDNVWVDETSPRANQK
ncbi:MAG: ABC transporter substrate-binding protein [Desulfobacteraceae bacterium]|nr:ABC transporter substrate-binding protein [Desulfobacteraceae bacterium]